MKITKQMLSIEKSQTEDQLIAGCKKQKPKAQKAIYEKMAGKMLGVCVRYLHDREEAEHVMIGAMVKVFEKIEQYSGNGSFEGWVRRIMVNECLMYIRKNRAMSLEVDIEEVYSEPNLEQLENQLESEDLMRLIGELPVGYRTVFNLYAIEGYNHAEIAERLGINENTSKSQLSRARKILQKRLVDLENKELNNEHHGIS
jgi:RNA polymerase sigma-70 factor (ECF subfamily)